MHDRGREREGEGNKRRAISSHSWMLLSLVLLLLCRVISDGVLSLVSLPFAGLRYFLSLLLVFVVLSVVDALVVAQTV